MEQLQHETPTVLITLSSFTAATFKGSLLITKRVGKHQLGVVYRICHLHQKVLLSNRAN